MAVSHETISHPDYPTFDLTVYASPGRTLFGALPPEPYPVQYRHEIPTHETQIDQPLVIDPGSAENPHTIGKIKLGQINVPVVARLAMEATNHYGTADREPGEFLVLDLRSFHTQMEENNNKKVKVGPYTTSAFHAVRRWSESVWTDFALLDLNEVYTSAERPHGGREQQLKPIVNDPVQVEAFMAPATVVGPDYSGVPSISTHFSTNRNEPQLGLSVDDRRQIVIEGVDMTSGAARVYTAQPPRVGEKGVFTASSNANTQRAQRRAAREQALADMTPSERYVAGEMRKLQRGEEPLTLTRAYRRMARLLMLNQAELPEGINSEEAMRYLTANYTNNAPNQQGHFDEKPSAEEVRNG